MLWHVLYMYAFFGMQANRLQDAYQIKERKNGWKLESGDYQFTTGPPWIILFGYLIIEIGKVIFLSETHA